MILTNEMYLASDSSLTQVVGALSPTDTEIQVSDIAVFPTAPNFATLGTETGAEVVSYGEIDTPNQTLKQVVRGRSFTTAQPWGAGTDIYHSWTAENHNAMVKNVRALGTHADGVGEPAMLSRLSQLGAVGWDSGNFIPASKQDNLEESHNFELGSRTKSKNTYIDFHTPGDTGQIFDYDARILVTRPAGAVGDKSGTIFLEAAKVRLAPLENNIIPSTDNGLSLGTSSRRWSTVYLGTAPIVGSDKNIKNEIKTLEPDTALAFLELLNPVSYKLVDGTSNRLHYGLVAQEVEEAMNIAGLSDTDFAGFIKSPIYKAETKTEEQEISFLDAAGEPKTETQSVKVEIPVEEREIIGYKYGLRYEEFIAPIISAVQTQQSQIKALEKRLVALEGK